MEEHYSHFAQSIVVGEKKKQIVTKNFMSNQKIKSLGPISLNSIIVGLDMKDKITEEKKVRYR